MSDFVIVKNIKSPIGDVYITGETPNEDVDYTLMVEVALYEITEKKGTGEENPDKVYRFEPTGTIRLIDPNGKPETPSL